MNNKGFTLVEVLAVIAIIGILSGVAVMGVTKYLQESKNQAYDILAHSSAVATENYILDSGATDSKVAIKDLVDKGYLENRIDPANKNKKCSGSVFIDRNETDETLSSNSYSVLLHCSGKIRSYKFSNANDGELNEEIYTEIELPGDTNISDDIDYDNNYNYTLYKIPRKQKLSLQNTETPYCYSDNYKFDEKSGNFKLSGNIKCMNKKQLVSTFQSGVYTLFSEDENAELNSMYYVTEIVNSDYYINYFISY